MAQLARRFGTGPASLTEIAEEEDLPRAYLEQLVTSLRDANLVLSTRGARGGYQLARPPAEIQMGEVLHALEGPIAPMICASVEHASTCERTGRCTVNLLWVRVRDAIAGALDSMTLADLTPPEGAHAAARAFTTGATTPGSAATQASAAALPVLQTSPIAPPRGAAN